MCETWKSYTKKVPFACGNAYLTVDMENGKPIHTITRVGKAGCCERVLLEAVSKLVNMSLADGKDLNEIVRMLSGLRCDKGMAGAGRLSCLDALAHDLRQYTIEEG
jgi:hypothetical protein